MSNSSAVAQQIARSLVVAGVREVVVAPGSRSAPLVYALAPLAEAGVIRTHVRIDERDAGFLALGLARGLRVREARARAAGGSSVPSGHPREVGDACHGAVGSAVALVTTSGSAVANLHPAVLEAAYGHLPLVAITADRPARLRGTGANQTIDDQAHVLSDVRARFDVPTGPAITTEAVDDIVAEALALALAHGVGIEGPRSGQSPRVGTDTTAAVPGPVQLNVQFDTPLVPTESELAHWQREVERLVGIASGANGETGTVPAGRCSAEVEAESRTLAVDLTPGTVVVAGDAGGWPAESLARFARAHALPVLAEPSSPLARRRADSAGGSVVPAHARVLRERPDLREAIRTVIVHGKPTLTRPVAALLADPDIRVQRLPDDIDSVRLAGSTPDTDDGVRRPGSTAGADWTEQWVEAGAALARSGPPEESRSDIGASRAGGSAVDVGARPEALARAVAGRLAAEPITLFAASSNAIRYLNDLPEIRADIHASRGLAGIDGLVSTATGLGLGLDEPVVLLIGDVALLHDVGGLLTPTHEQTGDIVIVVLNDDGGAIFGGLEHSQEHVAGYLERFFAVPHGRGFEQLADAYGWSYDRVSGSEEFAAAFARTRMSARSPRSGADVPVSEGRKSPGHRAIIEVDLTA